ncbi:hypothetical protein COEREDRAFT_97819 [Coemansia reversa NRRL 1564]|uniref:Uncharacterized protein n=1 Tax=Coemansia reversa (strain ATCC 12441 / NRRL 1564) TaxID=763665 RepID=A0A2G5BA78_COERN|nr:hypothetical protein COEREDRAFT_97819 [Coemansia reversa NRRL 1564]|eukprot:PIA15915.1 hypothetical protein COEREDRAFT_97819 [Coemansia reversa NRRL 1564]
MIACTCIARQAEQTTRQGQKGWWRLVEAVCPQQVLLANQSAKGVKRGRLQVKALWNVRRTSQQRQMATNATALKDRRPTHLAGAEDAEESTRRRRGELGKTTELQQLEETPCWLWKQVSRSNLEAIVRAYPKQRTRLVGELKQQHVHQRDLRRLHLRLRRAAESREQVAEIEERRAVYETIVRIIEDMRQLGMRVGATEIEALVQALGLLGQHRRAIEAWQAGIAWAQGVQHLFRQTHRHALAAAVALKDARVVRDVYDSAMRAMAVSRAQAGQEKQQRPGRDFFWALFPGQTHVPRKPSNFAWTDSDDGVWEPARLRAAFLARLLSDVRAWAADDRRLQQRTAQYLVRALFSEGRRDEALSVYAEAGAATREMVCEAVHGLGRQGQIETAYNVLAGAAREQRSIFAWNAYLDGLLGSMRWGSRAAQWPQAVLARMARVMTQMDADGATPDAATHSIWLRACFRAGRWQLAARYFAQHSAATGPSAACWDVLLRGLLTADSSAAQRAGWRLIDSLERRGALPTDRRLADTVLQYVLLLVTAHAEPAFRPDWALVDRAFAWAGGRLPRMRKHTYAVVIGGLVRGGRLGGALEVHAAMCARALWPPLAVNCMLVRAIAASELLLPHGNLQRAIFYASAFTEEKLPWQHRGAAYAALLRLAMQHRAFDVVWNIVDRHYPALGGADSLPRPFPDAHMYSMALNSAALLGAHDQHRLLLARMRCHIPLVELYAPLAARRMVHIYRRFAGQHHDLY